jgi:hypothetical protein
MDDAGRRVVVSLESSKTGESGYDPYWWIAAAQTQKERNTTTTGLSIRSASK